MLSAAPYSPSSQLPTRWRLEKQQQVRQCLGGALMCSEHHRLGASSVGSCLRCTQVGNNSHGSGFCPASGDDRGAGRGNKTPSTALFFTLHAIRGLRQGEQRLSWGSAASAVATADSTNLRRPPLALSDPSEQMLSSAVYQQAGLAGLMKASTTGPAPSVAASPVFAASSK